MAETKSGGEVEWEAQTERGWIECPSCGGTAVVRDYQRGSLACKNCGRVLRNNMMDKGPQHILDQEGGEKRSRGGAPMTYTLHDKGLSTEIDWRDRDGKGNNLNPSRRFKMGRLRKWQKRTRVSASRDKNLILALSEIGRMASQLGIPRSVREAASVMYRDAAQKQLIRGRSTEGMASAAIYAACRKYQVPRTLENIAETSPVDKKKIGNDYRFIIRELDIHPPPPNPISYVSRFGIGLDLSGEARSKAIEIIKRARERGLTSGKNPMAVAAGAIYVASVVTGERRIQRDVGEATGVSQVTVGKRYRELAEELDLDADP